MLPIWMRKIDNGIIESIFRLSAKFLSTRTESVIPNKNNLLLLQDGVSPHYASILDHSNVHLVL